MVYSDARTQGCMCRGLACCQTQAWLSFSCMTISRGFGWKTNEEWTALCHQKALMCEEKMSSTQLLPLFILPADPAMNLPPLWAICFVFHEAFKRHDTYARRQLQNYQSIPHLHKMPFWFCVVLCVQHVNAQEVSLFTCLKTIPGVATVYNQGPNLGLLNRKHAFPDCQLFPWLTYSSL